MVHATEKVETQSGFNGVLGRLVPGSRRPRRVFGHTTRVRTGHVVH